MSPHWRLALRYAVYMIVLAVLAGAAMFYFYGGAHAGALLYGIGVGVMSFVSTALTVSLLTGRSRLSRVVGVASFVGRFLFAVGALAIPAYLDLWPVLAMLGGFAGVYLAENVALLPMAFSVIKDQSARRDNTEHSVEERAERRAEA